MNSFLLYSAVLLLIALLFVVIPLLRYRPGVKTAGIDIRRQTNIEMFKQRLTELEKDRAEDIISAEDFERLKAELQRSFLSDMDDEKHREKGAVKKPGKLLPVLCLLFIPLFSYSLYEVVGSARDLELAEIMNTLTTVETPEAQLEELNRLAGFLQDRFERHDDDIQNGYMLGTLYLELENFDAAIATFAAVADNMEDGLDKATVLGQLAQAMYLADDSTISPETQAVIDQALALNANEFAVMSLLAIEAFVNEDFSGAVTYWRRQLLQLDGNSNQAIALRDRIARVEALLPQLAQTADAEPAEQGPSVTIIIDVDASVQNLVNDSMRLFVYARNPAMPMPLAAQNIPLPEFPFELTLDDSMAMIANMTLSTAENVIVGARLSRSGQATAQSGDIQAVSEPFVLLSQDEPVILMISEIVP